MGGSIQTSLYVREGRRIEGGEGGKGGIEGQSDRPIQTDQNGQGKSVGVGFVKPRAQEIIVRRARLESED